MITGSKVAGNQDERNRPATVEAVSMWIAFIAFGLPAGQG